MLSIELILLQSLVFLSAFTSPFAIDHDELNGVWVGVANQDSINNHSFLEITISNSGRFVFVAEGTEILDFEFDSEDLAEPEGYIEVSKSFDSWGAKVIVSGWISGEDGGLGMLTGQLFMYKIEANTTRVFNSFPLMMWSVSGPAPSKPADKGELQKIAAMYRSFSADE